MEEQTPVPPQMEQKTVKFEIGKLLAVIITVLVVAGVASVFLTSTYFKGSLWGADDYGDGSRGDCSAFTEADLNAALNDPNLNLTEEERTFIEQCLLQINITSNVDEEDLATYEQTEITSSVDEEDIATYEENTINSSIDDTENTATYEENYTIQDPDPEDMATYEVVDPKETLDPKKDPNTVDNEVDLEAEKKDNRDFDPDNIETIVDPEDDDPDTP